MRNYTQVHILVQVGEFCFNGCQCQLCIRLILALNQPAGMYTDGLNLQK